MPFRRGEKVVHLPRVVLEVVNFGFPAAFPKDVFVPLGSQGFVRGDPAAKGEIAKQFVHPGASAGRVFIP